MNLNNNGSFIGRITKDPAFFENSDGSTGISLTVAAKRNFRSGKDGNYESDFLEFRGYVRKGIRKGIYNSLHTGDLVGICYSLRSSVFEKEGNRRYIQYPFIEEITFMESKKIREDRLSLRNASTAPKRKSK